MPKIDQKLERKRFIKCMVKFIEGINDQKRKKNTHIRVTFAQPQSQCNYYTIAIYEHFSK